MLYLSICSEQEKPWVNLGKMGRCLDLGWFVLLLLALIIYAEGKKEVEVYRLKRGSFSVKLTNWGATVLSVVVPDKHGKLADVVLGYQSIKEYRNDSTYFGGLVGRVANRIGRAQFNLDGVHYELPANDGKNTLHGGPVGFNNVIWKVTSYKKDSHVSFTYDSHDGEQGFPGSVAVSVTYLLVKSNKLAIKMEARALNKPTPVNLASHTYWNLAGHASGDILNHTIQIFGSQITPVDGQLIPTGQILPVDNTPYDFRQPRIIGSKIQDVKGGYDINYALYGWEGKHGKGKLLKKAAVVHESRSGRRLELWTNAPGVQFYTGNMLKDAKGKGGAVYREHDGLCLETQGFPDSVNHPNFPSQIVNPGQVYLHVMVYRFTAIQG